MFLQLAKRSVHVLGFSRVPVAGRLQVLLAQCDRELKYIVFRVLKVRELKQDGNAKHKLFFP